MPTYLERYTNGDCAEVWADLVALGTKISQKSVLPDAEAVANETMRRARHNLEILIPRLAQAGYSFMDPILASELKFVNEFLANPKTDSSVLRRLERRVKLGLEPASVLDRPVSESAIARKREKKAELEAEVKRMRALPPLENPKVFYEPESQTNKYLKTVEERAGGPIPISLRAWYKHVGFVSLMGSHEVLNLAGNAIADPLVLVSAPDFYTALLSANPGDKRQVALSPDDLGKAGLPKSTPGVESPLQYQITIPSSAADFKFENEWRGTYFVNYLRKAFEWAGFPGWERDPNPPSKLISKLTKGLLPI
jgi:hypothetical protein